MKVRNTGVRDIAFRGILIGAGCEVEVENVKQSDLVGLKLEIIRPKKDKEI